MCSFNRVRIFASNTIQNNEKPTFYGFSFVKAKSSNSFDPLAFIPAAWAGIFPFNAICCSTFLGRAVSLPPPVWNVGAPYGRLELLIRSSTTTWRN